MFLRPHTLAQLRTRYPAIDLRGAMALLHASHEMAREWAAILTGRPLEAVADRYFVTPDGLGAFVVAANRNPDSPYSWVVVTWLRFGPAQQHHALRMLRAA